MRSRAVSLAAALGLALSLGCTHRAAPPPTSAEGADVSKSRQHAYNEAVDALHDQIHAPKADIAGVSQDDTTWNDSCLGCPKAGESCKQVLTPGYRIVLRVRDATYEYHTNRTDRVRLCGQNTVAPPPAPTPAM